MFEEFERLKISVNKLTNQLEDRLVVIDNPNVTFQYGDSHTIYFYVHENNIKVARFAFSFLHGCKGVLISHSIWVSEGYRGRGIGGLIQKFNHWIAKELEASILLSTVVESNKSQQGLMKNWTNIDCFDNVRTGNRIDILTIKVK